MKDIYLLVLKKSAGVVHYGVGITETVNEPTLTLQKTLEKYG